MQPLKPQGSGPPVSILPSSSKNLFSPPCHHSSRLPEPSPVTTTGITRAITCRHSSRLPEEAQVAPRWHSELRHIHNLSQCQRYLSICFNSALQPTHKTAHSSHHLKECTANHIRYKCGVQRSPHIKRPENLHTDTRIQGVASKREAST